MKKIITVLSALSLLLAGTGCIKDTGCQDKTLASEAGAIATYATSHSINGTTHSSGIYYEIITVGIGPNATIMDNVKVKYTGKFLDDTVFDSDNGTPVTLQVGGTIPGWQIALQQLKEGGKIRVLIPSTLAYGCAGRTGIPGNSILYFDIELIDIL